MPGVIPGVADQDRQQQLDMAGDRQQQLNMEGDRQQQLDMVGDRQQQMEECMADDCGDSSEEEEDQEGGGWINPENFAEACLEMGGALQEPAVGIVVGCVTSDFAMQVCSIIIHLSGTMYQESCVYVGILKTNVKCVLRYCYDQPC